MISWILGTRCRSGIVLLQSFRYSHDSRNVPSVFIITTTIDEYANVEWIIQTRGVDTSNLAAKSDFIALKS